MNSALSIVEGQDDIVRDVDGRPIVMMYDSNLDRTLARHVGCTSNHIEDAFSPLAAFLKANRRTAILSQTGGGNSTSVSI